MTISAPVIVQCHVQTPSTGAIRSEQSRPRHRLSARQLTGQPLTMNKCQDFGSILSICCAFIACPRNHIASKPCLLPLGVLSGLPSSRPPPLPRAASCPADVRGQRRHPERPHDRQLGGKPERQQAAHLLERPVRHHRVEARVDARRPRSRSGSTSSRTVSLLRQHRLARLALPLGQRAAGALQHLQRAHDALRIGRHQARGHLGSRCASIACSSARGRCRRLRHANRRARQDRSAGTGDRPSSSALK